jgi:hypothetical protein
MAPGTAASAPGSLLLEGCRFELGREIEADDAVFAISNAGSDAAVLVRGSELGAGFAGWFAPDCAGCRVEP